MWSYMMISQTGRASNRAVWRSGYLAEREAILENLAHSARSLAELSRRHARRTVEGADEVREIAESDVIGDIGNGNVIVGQKPCRMAQPRAHQILVRSHA